ncbi:ras and Rab interactor-like protein isoform X6 [Mustela erminea]|uniref:ras and Rab interactor-like protein isoform X6 n=1 Tax=Mustela erminea TaxID=36723 RepID=UPI001386B411|nr:ras and Rab interactor-like protein isoform X6 [Mustela erminea]
MRNTFTSCSSRPPFREQRPGHGLLASCVLRMAQLEDEASAGPINGERWIPSQVNGAGETPIGVLGTPEPLLRLWRTWGVWQVPELDIQDAEALLELWPPGVCLWNILTSACQTCPISWPSYQPAAPRNPAPHRVSWVEGPLSLEVHHPGPDLASLVEEKEKEDEDGNKDDYKDEENGPEDVLTHHIQALARARGNYVGRQFQSLRARLTSNARGPHRPGDPATELLQDVRHLLTDLQDHLSKDPDVRAVFGSRGPGVPQKDYDLGAAVEAALCRAVLAPLKPALWARLRKLRAQELRRLRQRQIALRVGAGPPGCQGAGFEGPGPAPALRSRIHARLEHLHAACAPRRKVALLLAVCTDVYAGLAQGENQEPLGADAFLPALTEELIWSPHIGETQLDVEFLMELLDPDELQGEAGYYLTTWFGALYHIAHYQPDAGRAPQGLSSEARASLRQWHSRRTLHRQDRQDHAGAQVSLPFEEPWARDPVPRDQ